MAVTLHRCPLTMLKSEKTHACWRVEKALQDAGVDYTLAKRWGLPKSKRTDIIAATGQSAMPAIQFEDGSWYREESVDMAAAIRAGKLPDKKGRTAAGAAGDSVDAPAPT